MLSEILGQSVAVQVLRNYLAGGMVAGSFLFVGPAHVGKAFAAREFAAAMLCEGEGGGLDACGVCASCRMVAGDRHPDLRTARPSGASRILRLPQIWPREGVKEFPSESALLRDLQFAPVRGRRRVFILEDADALNEDTANSLLKVLEEPPGYATFILTAPSASAVLPTIFSRCQTVRFQSVATAVIEDALTGRNLADASAAHFLAAYSQGQIGRAFSMAGDAELRAARETILDIAEKLSRKTPVIQGLKMADDLRKASAKLNGGSRAGAADAGSSEPSSRSSLSGALEMLGSWYRDILALCCHVDENSLVNVDRRTALKASAGGFSQSGAEQAIDLIVGVRDAIERNANAQIAVEALTLRLLSLNRKAEAGGNI